MTEHCCADKLVLIRARVHPFPSRTRKLSSLLLTILGWRRPGKIGSANTEPRDERRGVLLCRKSEFGMPAAPSRDKSVKLASADNTWLETAWEDR